MLRKNQSGGINALLFPLIASILLLIGAAVFGFWAYGQRQDYKNNSDQKSAAAAAAAVKAEDIKKDAQFAEASKSPYKTYVGPAEYGSLRLTYPKTWSAYIDETTNGSTGVDGYFFPDFVPATTAPTSTFALRVQVLDQSYSSVLQNLTSQVQSGAVTMTPYSLPKLKSVVGSLIVGQIVPNKQGSMVILPLRDKTIQIWTEATQYVPDFNNIILPNLTFSP